MRSILFGLLLSVVSLGALQGAALASTCYLVYDRGENVIYRDTTPPVDMSDRGAASRDALRQRGEFLLFIESDRCAPIAFLIGPGTPGTISVDQIVAGIPTMGTSAPDAGIVRGASARPPAARGMAATRTITVAPGR
jgi:hypothetical protein